jgi:hypothetical protein
MVKGVDMGRNAEVETPPDLTSAEFDALLVRLYPISAIMLGQGGKRVMTAHAVIQHLWIEGEPEGEDAALLRAHMKYLSRKGYFAFTDFRTEVHT